MNAPFEPGDFVRHPDRPDWGLGQVQSVIGERVTANFENAGKQTMLFSTAPLVLAESSAQSE
jgi:hypothetical protein